MLVSNTVDGLSRRGFLAGTAAAAGRSRRRPSRAIAAPAKFDGTIRVLGLGYDLDVPGSASGPSGTSDSERREHLQVSAGHPAPGRPAAATFDIFSCFQQDVAEFWTTGNLQPVEIARIQRWRSITPLYKLGRAQPGTRCAYGQGDAAFRRLYVDPDRSGRWRSAAGMPAASRRLLVQWVDESTGKPRRARSRASAPAFPARFNFDSFGYNVGVLRKRPGDAVVGGAPQRALAATRRSQLRAGGRAAGHGERRPGRRADEVRRSR